MKPLFTTLRKIPRLLLIGVIASSFVGMMLIDAVPPAHALLEAEDIVPATFPCPAFTECHLYEKFKAKIEQGTKTFQFAVVTGILNAFQFMTQKISIDVATWMLNGGKGKGTAFYKTSPEEYIGNLAKAQANYFLSAINDFTSEQWGFDMCAPITLSLKMGLGLAKIDTIGPPNCTFKQVADNFESVYRSMEPNALAKNMRSMLEPGGNDIGLRIAASQKFMAKLNVAHQAKMFERAEGQGIKPIQDIISGNIKTPAAVARDTVHYTNYVDLAMGNAKQSNTTLAATALWGGMTQLPWIAASTFVNTLATGALSKFFSLLSAEGDDTGKADLQNPDTQQSSQESQSPIVVGDIITPNLITQEKQDFLFELSSCPTPRGPWACSLDDGFVNALHSASKDGGNTIARSAGIGFVIPDSNIFLHKNWELIPEWEAKDNQDPGCYQRAYCASNLAKLRFARIISIGWELAANSPFNKKTNGKYVTLGEVVSSFNNCNFVGQADAAHPWCHLINPGWVLTNPQFMCQLRGFGDSMLSQNSGIRTQECGDVVSCLSSNDRGECTGGYGYCLSEKTVWRFGADECQERFVSCRTYTSRDKSQSLSGVNVAETATGPQVSYIRNTIDYGACNADTIGCQYYYTVRDTATTSTDAWVKAKPTNAALSWTSTYLAASSTTLSPRIYLDAMVKPCDASNDGCTKVFTVSSTFPALNLIKNSSFEDANLKDPKIPNGWGTNPTISGNEAYEFIPLQAEFGESTLDGGQSAQFPNKAKLSAAYQVIDLAPLRNYVASIYARKTKDPNPDAQLAIEFLKLTTLNTPNAKKIDGKAYLPTDQKKKYFLSPNCVQNPAGGAATAQAVDLTDEWQRFTCEFVSPQDVTAALVVVRGKSVAIDAVELEEGMKSTEYISGVNVSLGVDHLKIAPDELACTGDTKVDRAECANYARMCKQPDVGCQGYTDVEGGDGLEVPATLSAQDYCPNSCVGYAEYRKLPTAFDLTKDNAPLDDPEDDMLAYFIPKNAKQCNAAAVGCEEFTNIEAQASGGEQKVYYTYIRACEKPGPDTRTYFTWEGSDTAGYQLRTWSLMQKTQNALVDPSYPLPTTAPRIILKAGPSGAVKDPATCTEAIWKAGGDPDCRQFYDEQGNAFYRYFSQTVLSTPDCRDYRKNDSTYADCQKTGGTLNTSTKECLYRIYAPASNVCSAVDASCRGYIGTTGRNNAAIVQENFTTTSTAFYTIDKNTTDLKISNEALLVGDHSLGLFQKQGGPAGPLSAAIDFPFSTSSLYVVSFWAKTPLAGAGDKTIELNQKTNGLKSLGKVTLTVDWKRYELGPYTLEAATTGTIVFVSNAKQTYLDSISIQRLQDIVYVKKGSWVIPPECDQNLQGVNEPRAMLGCREYTDRKSRVVDVRQFSHLCRYENIGCSAFVDTRNSIDPYAQTFVEKGLQPPLKEWDKMYSGTVTTTRPGDRYLYLIDEPEAHCDAQFASCRSFGKPVFDAKQNVTSTEVVYLMDDVSNYVDAGGEPKMLCRPSELFCDRFTSHPPTGAVTSYFRDPGLHVCEWRDKVAMKFGNSQVQTAGWFIQSVEPATPCYPNKLSKGNTFLFEYAGVAGYQGWTALCPKDQAECTEFRDSNDHTDQYHPLGRPYFFIDNQKLDKSTCSGKVDLFSGCVLFRNMNDSQLLFSTGATYAKSKVADYAPVPTVNCDKDPNDENCKNTGICTDIKKPLLLGLCTGQGCDKGSLWLEAHQGASCDADTDCSVNYVSDDKKDTYAFKGRCVKNDSNLVLKVKLDRDCQTWLGCSTAETAYDPAQQKYVDLCTNLSACDQSLGATGKNFCAHYVDRNPNKVQSKFGSYKEPVLNQGAFLDYKTYTRRPTGFSLPDYSSFAMPNHFQVSDYVTRRVAYELLAKRPGSQRDRYIHDYRLAAAVPLSTLSTKQLNGPDVVDPNDAYVKHPGSAMKYTDPKYPLLNLCQHRQTGRIGYYNEGENPARCYFALDTTYSQNAGDVLGDTPVFNERNAQVLAIEFEQAARADLDQPLSQAFPNAECRAYPDSVAPFPNYYVKEWDFAADPPQPKIYVDGYDKVPYCEYGEECSCSYRKVSYGGVNKHYSLFGAPAPAGICSGGERDGQSCVPGVFAGGGSVNPSDVPQDDKAPKVRLGEPGGADSTQACSGGTCNAINTVSFVRGQYGQCVSRDMSRIVAGSQEHNPCLMWNPPPVLFGPSDIYHYQPTAGYLPPQNSGEYYCVAGALPPRTIRVQAAKGDDPLGPWITNPGQLGAFEFDEDYISDGTCFACEGNQASESDPEDITFIDGVHADGGNMGEWCEAADDNLNAGQGDVGVGLTGALSGGSTALVGGVMNTGHLVDSMAGRWIMTGRGDDKNYLEYFVGFNAKRWAKAIFPGAGSLSDDVVRQATMERRFGYFHFAPAINPNGRGLMGCGRTPEWVDGVTVDDYDDVSKLTDADQQWLSYFNQNFKGTMNRESADFLKDATGQLLPMNCYYTQNGGEATDHCYYKFWQIGYRDEGQKKFRMADDGAPFVNGGAPLSTRTDANKAFFSIRAMFEDTNKDDNNRAPDSGITGNELAGPFQFIGWWITSSVPGTASERAIYMYLTIGSIDTCREVAQVAAPDSHDVTAFNDRVWEKAGFSLPLLGYVYSSVNTPFSGAMHTRPIGVDPLFQVHGRLPGTLSKIKPPGFISSGSEYFTSEALPTGNWALLNNLFARIYRVYRYYDRAVGPKSSFCITGPRTGAFCTQKTAQADCGLVGTCNTKLVDPLTAPGFCNALSGVNSGLTCSDNDKDDLLGYHVCHNSAMFRSAHSPNELEPRYTSCALAPGWHQDPSSKDYFPCPGLAKDCPDAGAYSKDDAALKGALRCTKGSVTINGQQPVCTRDEDCPHMVIGDGKVKDTKNEFYDPVTKVYHTGCRKQAADGVLKNRCIGFENARCTEDSHCQFTETEWWGSYNRSKPWGGHAVDIAQDPDYGPVKNQYVRYNEKFVFKDGVGGIGEDGGYCGLTKSCEKAIPLQNHLWTYDVYGQDWRKFQDGKNNYAYLTTGGNSWWQSPTDPDLTPGTTIHGDVTFQKGEGDKGGPGKDIAGHNLFGGGFIRIPYPKPIYDLQIIDQEGNNIKSFGPTPGPLNRYPGAYAAAIVTKDTDIDREPVFGLFIPGHCEKTVNKFIKDVKAAVGPKNFSNKDVGGDSVAKAVKEDRPYAQTSWFCDDPSKTADFSAECDFQNDVGELEPDEWFEYQRYFGPGNFDPAQASTIGVCEGGAKEGATCHSPDDCKPANLNPDQIKEAKNWCKPVPVKGSGPLFYTDPTTKKTINYYDMCFPAGVFGDPLATDLDKDDNLCTHNSGYYPRNDLCGNQLNRSQCLTGYDLLVDRKKSIDPNVSLPPTDVTPGLYTNDNLFTSPGELSYTPQDFHYTAYYVPSPPRIAAPDMLHGCAGGGQCPISKPGAFSLENQAEGTVASFGGQTIVSMRFYAWAADNQGALKDMWIDWGDGTIQEFHDAKMKNKKPFCGVQTECSAIPGLTCGSDNDCPPAGGKCAPVGYCKSKSYKSCKKDSDCTYKYKPDPKDKKEITVSDDICVTRVTFGNSDSACEQNFFDFTHAYTCGKEWSQTSQKQCNDTKRCSRDNTRTCNTNGDCASGDKCLTGLAGPGGCYDKDKVACRFTPRLLIKDSWDWCTGECRTKVIGEGTLGTGPLGTEPVLYKNGGCYDGSGLYSNVDPMKKLGTGNSCNPFPNPPTKDARPWIVFNGAVQLGISQ